MATPKENKSVESSKKGKVEADKNKVETETEKLKDTDGKPETDKSETETETKPVEKLLNNDQPSENKDSV